MPHPTTPEVSLEEEFLKLLTGMDLHYPSAVEMIMPDLLAICDREKRKSAEEALRRCNTLGVPGRGLVSFDLMNEILSEMFPPKE